MDLPAPEGTVQRKAGAGGDHAQIPQPAGGGQPLPGPVRTKMEASFGANFSAVRVHEGPQASALGAVGYTQGTDLHFAPGQYQPESQRGQELLGHELAHVVQQSEGRVAATTQFKGVDGNDDASLEHEADEWGARAARGEQVRRSGASGGGAIAVQRKVVQRSPQPSHYGRFLDTEYTEHPRGVTVKLEFEPGAEVDATKIGMTQSFKVSHNGASIPFDAQRSAREVSTGPGAGYQLDRVAGRNNPIYGSEQASPGQGLPDTPQNNTPSGQTPELATNTTYELGHRSPGIDHGAPKNAGMYDRPSRAPAPGTAMEFETTALAIEGAQQGTYYGSVKWGWHVDGSGTLTKDPFALVSQGTPSQNFLAAAAQWNSVTAGGTLKARNAPTQVFSRSGSSFAPSFTIAQNTIVVSNGMTSVPSAPTSYMNITVQGGPENGRSGFVPAGDLVDQADGPATLDVPVPQVHTLRSAQTLNEGLSGPWRDTMTLPVGTRVVPDPGNRPGSAVPAAKVWVRVVDGASTGATGYVDQVELVNERP